MPPINANFDHVITHTKITFTIFSGQRNPLRIVHLDLITTMIATALLCLVIDAKLPVETVQCQLVSKEGTGIVVMQLTLGIAFSRISLQRREKLLGNMTM